MKHLLFITSVLLFISSCSTSQIITYDQLNKGTWSEITTVDNSLPVERHEAAFVNVKDKLYLIGGRGLRTVSIYTPKTNKWTQGSVVPIEIHHFQPVVVDEEVYFFGAMTGGYPGETPLEDIHVYSPNTDTWRTEGKIPSDRARGGTGAVHHNGKIYMICGIKDGHRGDHKTWTDSYDLKTKTWTKLADAPRARDHFHAAVLDGKIYSIAGRTTVSADNPFKRTIGQVDVYDIASNTWTTLDQDLPTWRAGTSALVMGDEVIIFGGESFTQEAGHAEIEALNVKTKTWRSLPSIPRGRHGTALVHYNGSLWTASGSGNRGGGPEMTDLWKFEF